MKRGATSYITKDSGSDDEIEEIPGEGFRKADEAVLATRKIRGLPKRSNVEVPSASPAPSAASLPEAVPISAPKFGGFAGFGTPSSSFTFAPQAATTSSSSTTSFFRGSAPLPPGGPTVAPTASNTAKTFASFLGDSSSISTPAPASPSSEDIDVDDPAAYKYYTSLRGLNVSLLDAMSKATQEDPFVDLSDFLERYQSLRLNARKEFGEIPKSTSQPAPLQRTSMPAPPAKFTGFSPPSASTQIANGESSGGFLPKPASASSTPASGFSFTPTPTLTPPTTSSTGFSFAAPPSQASASASSNPFALPSSSTTTSTFTSVFGTSTSSPFGTSTKNTSTRAPFTFGAPPSTTSSSSLFGSTTSTGSTINIFGSDQSSTNTFGTTVPSTTPTSKPGAFGGFGGFGKPPGGGGSIGNPVGFGFGSPTKIPDGEASAGGSNRSSPFSVGSEKKSDSAEEGGETADDKPRVDPAATFSLSGNNPHDEEGEGEEQEDTVHAVKLRAFRLKKAEEERGSGWAELGYGVLRLKKHKETEARRLLLRNSSTGKININFNLYSGLKPSQSKKTVTFVGHEGGVSQTYSVRLQGEEQAKSLKDVLDKEIAFVKAKSDD